MTTETTIHFGQLPVTDGPENRNAGRENSRFNSYLLWILSNRFTEIADTQYAVCTEFSNATFINQIADHK